MRKRFAFIFGIPLLVLTIITMIMCSIVGPFGLFLGPMITLLIGLFFSIANLVCSDLFFYCLHGRKRTYLDDGITCLEILMNFKKETK